MTIRVALDEADFRTLVAGEIVKKPRRGSILSGVAAALDEPVEIALSDIGWVAMVRAISLAFPQRSDDEPG